MAWLNYRSGAWRWENSLVAFDENWNLLGDVLEKNLVDKLSPRLVTNAKDARASKDDDGAAPALE